MDEIKTKRSYLRYAGLAGQWLGMLAAGVLIGWGVDSWLNLSFPWFMLCLPVLMLVGSLIKLVLDVGGKKTGPKNTP